MRGLLILLLLAAPAVAAEAPDVRLETAVPTECWLGQEVPVTLRVLVDLEAFEAASVQLFARAMDLQLKLTVPWAETPPAKTPAGAETLSLVLNDAVVPLRRVADRDGRAVLEATWTLRPDTPGPLELAAPTCEFAWATEFEDDFVSGRRPMDPRPEKGTGEVKTVAVRALPPTGALTTNYGGAVGRFTVRASAEPREVAVGEEITLTLRIEGEGNLAGFETPAYSPDGFHVLGRIDDRAAPVRTVRYDLTPTRGGIAAIPPVPVPFFDPEIGQYVVVAAEPIPIVVTGTGPEEAVALDEDESGFPWPVLLGAVVALIAVLIVGLRTRRKPAEPEGPTPAEIFGDQVDADVTKALTTYLASRLGCDPAAVISPDLADRLEIAGVPGELAERANKLLAELVGARYGGEAGGDERDRAIELVEEFEAG